MALPTSSCLPVDQKRDFDLALVLESLKKSCLCKASSATYCTSSDYETADNLSSATDVQDSKLEVPNASASFKCSSTFDVDNHNNYQKNKHGTRNRSQGAAVEVLSNTQPHLDRTVAADSRERNLGDCQEILVEEYLRAFTELTRFFKLTGPIFAFVARDLSKKITHVQSYLNSSSKAHYTTLKDMVEYEVETGTVRNKGANSSATRTMLRLHWALEFFIDFMNELRHATDDTKASTLVYEVYQRTLALHHPWYTRKLARLAVYALPSIKSLIDIMCKHNYDEVKLLLSDVVEVTRPILKHTRDLYELHGLSHIP